MTCHPKDRVIWRELQEWAKGDPGLRESTRCAEEYMEYPPCEAALGIRLKPGILPGQIRNNEANAPGTTA